MAGKIKTGKIEKVGLREVWKDEARDFTPWLFDNLEIVGDDLGLELTPVKMEESVGPFRADIIASDGDGRIVVVENQFGKTNHDHLGKILTYAANMEAKIVIWIAERPQPEHQTAIEWLNETGGGVDFYLVKIEALRIDQSIPAPRFALVAGPSEKTQSVSREKKQIDERHKLGYDFWKTLLEKSEKKTHLHAGVSPRYVNHIGCSAGKQGLSYSYAVTYKHGRAELYIDTGAGEENAKIFDALNSRRAGIEEVFGGKLNWDPLENRRGCRISKAFESDGMGNPETRDKLQDDMIDAMIRLEKALSAPIKALKLKR